MAISGLFLLLYGAFRILIEFVRIPDEGRYVAYGWITKGQLLSAPMVAAGLALVALAYTREKRGAVSSPAVDEGVPQKTGPDKSS
jgi:phosphatidylglycerol:prolipoprotein diacylglycerol transferase